MLLSGLICKAFCRVTDPASPSWSVSRSLIKAALSGGRSTACDRLSRRDSPGNVHQSHLLLLVPGRSFNSRCSSGRSSPAFDVRALRNGSVFRRRGTPLRALASSQVRPGCFTEDISAYISAFGDKSIINED